MPPVRNARELARLVAEREGRKVSMSIAQISEVISVLADIQHERTGVGITIHDLGHRRARDRNRRRERDAKRMRALMNPSSVVKAAAKRIKKRQKSKARRRHG